MYVFFIVIAFAIGLIIGKVLFTNAINMNVSKCVDVNTSYHNLKTSKEIDKFIDDVRNETDYSFWYRQAKHVTSELYKKEQELVKMKRQITRLATHKYEKTLHRLRKAEKENDKLRAINKLLQSGIALPELQIEDPFIPKDEENT